MAKERSSAKGKVIAVIQKRGLDPDLRGFQLVMEDLQKDVGMLSEVRSMIGEKRAGLFNWREEHDGTDIVITAVVKEIVHPDIFKSVKDDLAALPAARSCHLLHEKPVDLPRLEHAQVKVAGYDSSWYWPTSDRFPRSDYTNPTPIRIAQADTGVSLHPNLIGGFDPAKSMNFYFPPNERKGKGVICWDTWHPIFISHGTSTGGMMIGRPADNLPLEGMTVRDVVELVPCRVAESVILIPSDLQRLADCINWAVDEGIKVVNVSLGAIATPNDPALVPLTKAVERACKSGVIICCASGQITLGMIWPAVYALKGWVICCGPSKEDGDVSHQSTWLTFADGYVSIGAPGENMPQAAWKDGVCYTNVPELGASEGSSYSAAFTSSVAALWWAMNHDTLSKMDLQDIVPTFRNTIQKTCTKWNRLYPAAKVGPGILNPDKAIKAVEPPSDRTVDSSGVFHIERVPGGTYRNLTLHAHGSGSVHVIEPVFVEGKLTLKAESSGTISMSGTIICRKLEIICHSSATIHSDDLEYYESCEVDVKAASTCKLYIAAEGPMTGKVEGPYFINGSTFIAWIYWRQGRKTVSVSKDTWSTVQIANDWGGRWA
jgi:Subtilase family